ncbi:MAG: hypothetical protein J5614_06780 [Paludibacteraceae bacterium]|nr:hypothetical protein [Paludibacteraceae bacterium]
MKVYTCDRCGKLVDSADPKFIKVTFCSGHENLVRMQRVGYVDDLDLCRDCFKSLRKWFNENRPPVVDDITAIKQEEDQNGD